MAKKILIISAHPDDEVIGMGGTMLKHKKSGDLLYWLIMTDATHSRWDDAYRAQKKRGVEKVAAFYGIKKTFFSGFPAMELNLVPTSQVCDSISNVIREVKPDTVYCPPPQDINHDHAVAFDAARVAVRGLSDNTVKEFLAYEIPTTTRFCDISAFFVPNVYVDVSKEFKQKLRAFNFYKTEKREFPHPRSFVGLEIAAKERGLAIGATHAEGFIIIKSVR